MKSVLILDPDLGFLVWLGQALAVGGYLGVPAPSVPEAIALIGKLDLMIDLLVLDPTLPGSGEFARSLRAAQGRLRVIAVIASMEDLKTAFPGVDAVRFRPILANDLEASKWLNTVRRLLADSAVPR